MSIQTMHLNPTSSESRLARPMMFANSTSPVSKGLFWIETNSRHVIQRLLQLHSSNPPILAATNDSNSRREEFQAVRSAVDFPF